VENFFGRPQGKFAIMTHRWTFGEPRYPAVFTVCCALVNFDLRRQGGSPPRAWDGTFFRKLLTVLSERPEEEEARGHQVPGGSVGDGEIAGSGDQDEDGPREEDEETNSPWPPSMVQSVLSGNLFQIEIREGSSRPTVGRRLVRARSVALQSHGRSMPRSRRASHGRRLEPFGLQVGLEERGQPE
jgi:hypothetical protein